MYCIYCYKF